jgi:hypothetical protein
LPVAAIVSTGVRLGRAMPLRRTDCRAGKQNRKQKCRHEGEQVHLVSGLLS